MRGGATQGPVGEFRNPLPPLSSSTDKVNSSSDQACAQRSIYTALSPADTTPFDRAGLRRVEERSSLPPSSPRTRLCRLSLEARATGSAQSAARSQAPRAPQSDGDR